MFGNVKNQQRSVTAIQTQITTNPFAKKKCEKDEREGQVAEDNRAGSVQSAVAKFNSKVQQSWGSQVSYVKKEVDCLKLYFFWKTNFFHTNSIICRLNFRSFKI